MWNLFKFTFRINRPIFETDAFKMLPCKLFKFTHIKTVNPKYHCVKSFCPFCSLFYVLSINKNIWSEKNSPVAKIFSCLSKHFNGAISIQRFTNCFSVTLFSNKLEKKKKDSNLFRELRICQMTTLESF